MVGLVLCTKYGGHQAALAIWFTQPGECLGCTVSSTDNNNNTNTNTNTNTTTKQQQACPGWAVLISEVQRSRQSQILPGCYPYTRPSNPKALGPSAP